MNQSSRVSNFLACAMLAALLAASPAGAYSQDQPTLKLVVVVVVDQMRSDYLTRFKDLYTGGFHTLTSGGAWFINAEYPYSGTYTGPGHATILSGVPPAVSGIVSNSWYVPSLKRSIGCVEDTAVHLIGGKETEGHSSPVNFLGSNFVDEFRRGYENSKVFAVSIKDRSAILTSGKNPNGAYWFDPSTGRFGASTYYRQGIPNWVNSFNNKHLPSSYIGKTWKKLLPESAYTRSGSDSVKVEGLIPGERSTKFPHKVYDGTTIPGGGTAKYEPMLFTPYGNDLLAEFAETAIDSEGLGRQDQPDMLIVSFSSTDYIGHTFGPESHEAEDGMLRLDKRLGEFFKFLDARVGLGNTLIALTADHGCAPLPELHKSEGAVRVSAKAILENLRAWAGKQYGYDESAEHILAAYTNDYIYIDTTKLAAHNIDAAAFSDSIAAHLLSRPEVARAYTRSILTGSGAPADDTLLTRVRLSFNPARSGAIAVVLKPLCINDSDPTGSTHGSPYWYDRRVPLIFSGYGIKPGAYSSPASPLDLVPTLARILGGVSNPAGCAGKPLSEAIQ